MKGTSILLGVSGGIAAYKAAALCSKLVQAGANVNVIMTESAAKFITPLTLQTLSRNRVATDTFDEQDPSVVSHIDLADHADLVLIAPATANIIGKMAHGLADDMLSTTLLATTAPILVAPAMNVHMYAHPAVQANMDTLRGRGVQFIEPGEGLLACGYVGKGRLAEPEDIVMAVRKFVQPDLPLKNKRVLVTAGGTVERLDPVRYLTNDSSGKMGYALAEEAKAMGAEVVLVSGPTALSAPAGVSVVPVQSAEDMKTAVLDRLAESDIVIKAAAVADYRPEAVAEQKIKKKEDVLTLRLVKNPDILQLVGQRKAPGQLIIGFAAETENVEHYAMDKLRRKNCDLLVANDVSQDDAGFGTDTNIVTVFDKDGVVEELPVLPKKEVARRILTIAASRLAEEGRAR